jgi:hypothetical protein
MESDEFLDFGKFKIQDATFPLAVPASRHQKNSESSVLFVECKYGKRAGEHR